MNCPVCHTRMKQIGKGIFACQNPNCLENIKTRLANWIDTACLAGVVIEEMEEIAEPNEITLETAKNIWLKFLETELSHSIENCVKYPQGL